MSIKVIILIVVLGAGIAMSAFSQPAAPANLRVFASSGVNQIHWDANTATSYNIYRSIDRTNFTLLGTTALTDYADNTVSDEQTYFYRVTGVNGMGEGAASVIDAGTPTDDYFRFMEFDGVSDSLLLSPGDELQLDAQSFTIDLWVWVRNLPVGANFSNLVARYSAANQDRYVLRLNSSGQLDFRIFNVLIGFTTQEALSTDQWHHVAVTYFKHPGFPISANEAKIYIDGVEATPAAGATAVVDAQSSVGGKFVVGGDPTGNQRFFDGYLDELRVWNTLKSAAEVLALRCTRSTGNEANLVGLWHFDEKHPTSPMVFDYSVNTNNGGANATILDFTPAAVDDQQTTQENTAVQIDIQDNDTTYSGNPLSASMLVGYPQNGMASLINNDSTISYTPTAGFTGMDTIRYVLCDHTGICPGNPSFVARCDTATVAVMVRCADQGEVDWNQWALFEDPRDSLMHAPGVKIEIEVEDPDGILSEYEIEDNLLSVHSLFWVQDETAIAETTTSVMRFSQPVDQLCFSLYDVDALAGSFEDQVVIDGYNGGIKIDLVPGQFQLGSKVSYLGNNRFAGTDQVMGSISTDGNVDLCFLQTVDSVRLTFGQGPAGLPNLELHHIGIGNLTWCEPVNRAPFFDDGSSSPLDTMNFATMVNIPVDACFSNAVDPDLDSLTLTSVTAITGTGSIDLANSADTCFTYTPPVGFSGLEIFDATICDNRSPSLCGNVIVKMQVNTFPPPQAISDTVNLGMQQLVDVDVLGNDLNPGGETLNVTINTNPANGSATVLGNNQIQYQPNPAFSGIDSLIYQICDPSGVSGPPPVCDQAIVYFNVAATNVAPSIVDGNSAPADTLYFETVINTSLAICLNIVDPDLDQVTVTNAASINGSSVLVTAFPADTCLNYDPTPGFTGLEWLSVTVCDDGTPSLCDQAVLGITVNPYDPPVAVDDFLKTTQGTAAIVDVQANDTNPFTPRLPTAIVNGYPLFGATLVLDDDSVRYSPGSGFFGVDTVRYSLCDPVGIGGTPQCDEANVTVYVECRDRTDLDFSAMATGPIGSGSSFPIENVNIDLSLTNPANTLTIANDLQNTEAFLWRRAANMAADELTIRFSHPVNQFCFDLLDVDLVNGNLEDIIQVNAYTNGQLLDLMDYDSQVGPSAQFNGSNQFLGVADAPDLAPDGNVSVCFFQEIDSVVLNWRNSLGMPSSEQLIGLNAFSWCEVVNNAPVIVEFPGVEADTLEFVTDANTPLDFCLDVEDVDGDRVLVDSVATLTIGGNVSYDSLSTCMTYTPITDFVGYDLFRISVCDTRNLPLCDEVMVRVVVEGEEPPLPDPSEVLQISQGISPNGDGILDYWIIEGIDIYQENLVQVYNVWGDLVYEIIGYDNDGYRWDGTSNINTRFGRSQLPDGTYYYIIYVGEEFERLKGFIVLKK